MNEIASNVRSSRLCLLSFILLCSVFTSENAFTRKQWQREDLVVNYLQKNRLITFYFLFDDYLIANNEHGFLEWMDFSYSDGSVINNHIMRATTTEQKGKNKVCIKLSYKNPGERLQIFDSDRSELPVIWEDSNEINIDVKARIEQHKVDENCVTSKRCYLKVKWEIPQACKLIKSIKVQGFWRVNDKSRGVRFKEIYPLDDVKSNSKTMKNAHFVLKSEISDNVKVAKDANVIIVTGVQPGENIKFFTVSGVEVKSVVANDDVVNIKLPNNQIYIVKAGESRYKIAL